MQGLNSGRGGRHLGLGWASGGCISQPRRTEAAAARGWAPVCKTTRIPLDRTVCNISQGNIRCQIRIASTFERHSLHAGYTDCQISKGSFLGRVLQQRLPSQVKEVLSRLYTLRTAALGFSTRVAALTDWRAAATAAAMAAAAPQEQRRQAPSLQPQWVVEDAGSRDPFYSRDTVRKAYRSACFTLSLGVLGGSVLPLPFAICKTGVLLGGLTMLLVAWTNVSTCWMLIRACAHTGRCVVVVIAACVGCLCLCRPSALSCIPLLQPGSLTLCSRTSSQFTQLTATVTTPSQQTHV